MTNRPKNSGGTPARDEASGGRGMGLLTALYYVLKQALPRRVRYMMRRIRAHHKLATARDWPIMESAGVKPAGWKGWPGGKQFALVLTHDVEEQIGVDRCEMLAAQEARLGFHSSFNFIPEGGYAVTQRLRGRLTGDGFEVGVHDLHHDGSLYQSRTSFRKAAVHINRYLKEWGAVGFRAGFMFHNLEWIKDLEIEYDASTFDTDPFEPQPDGVGTVFPFWVPGHAPGKGYVELPYSLPQDSTMFLILRERAIEVWKEKLAWVAERGGMALLNLHPDYVGFNQSRLKISEFAPEIYEEFLTHVKERYAGAYWHALPKDVARHYRSQMVP